MRSEGTYPSQLFDSCILGEWFTCWGGGGGGLGIYAQGGIVCLPLISSGNGHINPRFFRTFPIPKNTMVKEPFIKKIFDICQPEDPNGGINIFLNFSHLSFFRVFRPQTGHGQIRPR